ncbi:gamma subclass chorismate mutase AroQ [Streptomyces longispororuber]|uniref:gamma subclass chorismate mutase AroQ n=1 Tax=Streptomyces longispororuber TaxID=68230 RepID=UPI0027E54C47|nr:gamma subclass chorismate mutase AroQ [Streptomyces longispororuber]
MHLAPSAVSSRGRLLAAGGAAALLLAAQGPATAAPVPRPAATASATAVPVPRPAATASATAVPVPHPVATAAPVPRPAAAASAAHPGPYARLHVVVGLSARRLATAEPVAAAKYGTGGPVDDPARERRVLDAVARQAVEAGGGPGVTVRVFRDQIEAHKAVQRALHRRWDADPASAPAERPRLDAVREEIDRVNGELVRALAAALPARTAPSCAGLLAAATAQVRHERALDGTHAVALGRAVRAVCG